MQKLIGPKQIPISQIRTMFYVRETLNEDRVLEFALLYQAEMAGETKGSKKIPPLIINANSELIDGRHRLEALKFNDQTMATCFISSEMSRKENIIEAVRANLGGALPPTQADMEHAIELLMQEGVKTAQIKEMFPLPPSVVTKYLQNIKRRTYNRTIGIAIEAVMERGYTIERAAEQYKIPSAELKTRIQGRKKGKGGILDASNRGIEFRTRGYSQYLRGCLGKLRKEVMDGNLSKAEYDAFVNRCAKSANGIMRTIENYRERMDAAASLSELDDE